MESIQKTAAKWKKRTYDGLSSHSGRKRRAHAVLSNLGRSGNCRLLKAYAFTTNGDHDQLRRPS